MPVQKSDVLTIPEEGKWRNTTVTWKQQFKEHKKNYVFIEFTNTRANEAEKTNFLFVSEELLNEFKSKIQKTDVGFKLTVDDDYVFGQSTGSSNRFLVYHDKDRAISLHRFIEGIMDVMAKQTTEISIKLGFGEVKVVSGTLAGLVGGQLRPWSEV